MITARAPQTGVYTFEATAQSSNADVNPSNNTQSTSVFVTVSAPRAPTANQPTDPDGPGDKTLEVASKQVTAKLLAKRVGKTWVVDGEPQGAARRIAAATATAMTEIQAALRPGARLSMLQATGRTALRQAGLPDPDGAFIFFHGLGLEHIDMEVPASHHDWTVEDGMVVSAHLQVPGDARQRSWLEEIFLVTRAGGEPFFTWGNGPIAR